MKHKLINNLGALSAVSTGLTAAVKPDFRVWWKLPLLAAGYFAGYQVLTIVLAYIGSEVFIDLEKKYDKPDKFWEWLYYEFADLLCFYGRVRIHVSGEEKLPEDSRFLLVCNHRSYFDPLCKMVALRDKELLYISKDENFKIPVGGKLMHASGVLSLNRENNREALKTIKRAAGYIKNDLGSVVIYPSGTRSTADELLPFHAGSFKIAQKAGVPVAVCALRNTDTVQHNFPFRHTDVYIDIIDLIEASFVKEQGTHATAERAQREIQQWLDTHR